MTNDQPNIEGITSANYENVCKYLHDALLKIFTCENQTVTFTKNELNVLCGILISNGKYANFANTSSGTYSSILRTTIDNVLKEINSK